MRHNADRMAKEKKHMEVTVKFKNATVNVVASNEAEAKKLAYEKVAKKNISRLIDKIETNVNPSFYHF